MNRDIGPMQGIDSLEEPQTCGAKTRSGAPCRNHPVTGKRRCRMHGGAKGSGGQPGNKHALKHGRYSTEAVHERRDYRELMLAFQQLAGDYANGVQDV